MKRIHDSLQRVFQRHRLVFWYDAHGEWADTFSAFVDDSVAKLTVASNEFGTKVRVVRDPNPEARFLIYVPTARPADADNWLLDLLLQGYEYKADKASLALQEAGLPHEFLHLAEDHGRYFASGPRVQALKELIHKDDQSQSIRLKMMSVLAGTAVEVDALLLQFLGGSLEVELITNDPVTECFGAAGLVEAFWKEVERLFCYAPASPSLRDFAVSLFRGAIPENTKGWSYRRLFAKYLIGARNITVSDPYVRAFWQIRNFMELVQLVHDLTPDGEETRISLLTKSDPDRCVEQDESLKKVQDSCAGSRVNVEFDYDNNDTFHARSITTDTGWKISLDRGLDIYQRYDISHLNLVSGV